ncbi:hypothetical protein BASA81_018494 [Batrachochytrium salamandrivorans]|nr:hypothetical protein BASA81_018494 [Batrachochytrium salamandrivorans]
MDSNCSNQQLLLLQQSNQQLLLLQQSNQQQQLLQQLLEQPHGYYFKKSQFDQQQFLYQTTHPTPRGISDIHVFGFRLFVASFGAAFTVLRIIQFDSLIEYSLFLTNWCWISMTLYFAVAALCSWLQLLTVRLSCPNHPSTTTTTAGLSIAATHADHQGAAVSLLTSDLIPRRPSSYRTMIYRLYQIHSWLYVLTHVVNWIVPPVYWLVLRQDFTQPEFTRLRIACTIIEHSAGLVFLLVDMGMNSVRVQMQDAVSPLAVGLLYLGWVWTLHYAGQFSWPYFFFDDLLNPAVYSGWAMVGLATTAVAIVGLTWLVRLLHLFRDLAFGYDDVPLDVFGECSCGTARPTEDEDNNDNNDDEDENHSSSRYNDGIGAATSAA